MRKIRYFNFYLFDDHQLDLEVQDGILWSIGPYNTLLNSSIFLSNNSVRCINLNKISECEFLTHLHTEILMRMDRVEDKDSTICIVICRWNTGKWGWDWAFTENIKVLN